MQPLSRPAGGRLAEPLLVVAGLAKRFGGVRALDGVSFGLDEGEVKCIIGPNGCGKSTLFNVLSGVLKPDAGQAFLGGLPIAGLAAHRVSRLGIGRKFQVPGILPELTPMEHLEIAIAARQTEGRIARLVGWAGARAEALGRLEAAGLADYADRPAQALPHGIKQRLEILLLVARGARLLLLDEPTAGMTEDETMATIALIRAVNRDTGAAVLVIEHDMAFVRSLACPILVMMRGQVLCEGGFDEVRADPRVRAAYLGDRHA